MRIRRITVQNILFFETIYEFSVYHNINFFILSAYRGKFANFFTLLHKNFVRCPLPGGVRCREVLKNIAIICILTYRQVIVMGFLRVTEQSMSAYRIICPTWYFLNHNTAFYKNFLKNRNK